MIDDLIESISSQGDYNYVVNLCDIDLTYEIGLFGIGTSVLGAIQLVLGYVMVFCLNTAAENQVNVHMMKILSETCRDYIVHTSSKFHFK